MPIVNFTIPDSSPFISYLPQGSWGDSDTATEDYTNGTFHFTNVKGATASFPFNGSAVYLYGALRANHDVYTVTLDGQTGSANGHTDANPGVFNTTLFAAPSITLGAHNVKLANTPTDLGYVDLDWAVITVGDGNQATVSNDFWLDDSHGNFTYDPSWSAGVNSFSTEYFNSSFHVANTAGAKATLSFYGNAVALYGATSTNHGPFSVALDGMPATSYNGSQVAFRPQNLLYFAHGLASTMHTLEVANAGTTFTDIDYAVVSVWDATEQLAGALGAPASSAPAGAATTTAAAGTGAGTTGAKGTATVHVTSTLASGTDTGASLNPTESSGATPRWSARKGGALLFAIALAPLLLAL